MNLRFRTRTLLVVTLAVAAFLTWRLHDPEADAIRVIEAEGGKVHFAYQHPYLGSYRSISVAQLHNYRYFQQIDLAFAGAKSAPEFTLNEIVFGNSEFRKVAAVELRIEQCTPEVVAQLKYLSQLEHLVVEMPNMFMSGDCDQIGKLEELQREFGDLVVPTVSLFR